MVRCQFWCQGLDEPIEGLIVNRPNDTYNVGRHSICYICLALIIRDRDYLAPTDNSIYTTFNWPLSKVKLLSDIYKIHKT